MCIMLLTFPIIHPRFNLHTPIIYVIIYVLIHIFFFLLKSILYLLLHNICNMSVNTLFLFTYFKKINFSIQRGETQVWNVNMVLIILWIAFIEYNFTYVALLI